jgi:uncharacterized FAD-dependent dehydrogenase
MGLFDVAIIGAGVAGSVAAYRIKKANEKIKLAIIDVGRPPLKRRRQIEGWLGCLPNSDGKLYTHDLNNLKEFLTEESIESGLEYYMNLYSSFRKPELTKNKPMSKKFSKELNSKGYSIEYSDYYQIFPKDIHQLSKKMSSFIEDTKFTEYFFDTEVISIEKDSDNFCIKTEESEILAKKIIFSPGRSGWRFAKSVFDFFKLEQENDYSYYGVRAEVESLCAKDFNKSICTLNKDDLMLGRFSWAGTTIQEDHIDIAISSFRSNENRWLSDKVSFDVIKKVHNPGKGMEESERISKLSFLLANDRVLKEKISVVLSGKAKISPLKEYNWLLSDLEKINDIMPEFTTKASVYYPSIIAVPPKVKVSDKLETQINGLYLAGETLTKYGILFSAISGIQCADNVMESL